VPVGQDMLECFCVLKAEEVVQPLALVGCPSGRALRLKGLGASFLSSYGSELKLET